MDGRALTRLRIAFLLLGAALLLPLALLLRSVDARLEAQRRLRHELVAERIFDEMEGELTALLSREDSRPSAAYVDSSTRVENWAPFVVGYFTRDQRGMQIVAKPQLAPERLHRLETTLRGAQPTAPAAAPSAAHESLEDAEGRDHPVKQKAAHVPRSASSGAFELAPVEESPGVKGLGAVQQVQPLPEAILKQLNRAADVRERKQSQPASKRKAKARSDDNDPLSSFE